MREAERKIEEEIHEKLDNKIFEALRSYSANVLRIDQSRKYAPFLIEVLSMTKSLPDFDMYNWTMDHNKINIWTTMKKNGSLRDLEPLLEYLTEHCAAPLRGYIDDNATSRTFDFRIDDGMYLDLWVDVSGSVNCVRVSDGFQEKFKVVCGEKQS